MGPSIVKLVVVVAVVAVVVVVVAVVVMVTDDCGTGKAPRGVRWGWAIRFHLGGSIVAAGAGAILRGHDSEGDIAADPGCSYWGAAGSGGIAKVGPYPYVC